MDVAVSGPGEGELFVRSDRTLLVKAELESLSAIEIEFEPSFSVPHHSHDDHTDAFYVLAGEVEFLLEDGPVRLGAGSFVAAPPGTIHGFANPGPGKAKLLNLHAPDAGFVGFVRGD